MKYFSPLVFVFCFLLASCDNNDDKAKTVDTAGSIEVSLKTAHIDSLRDLLTTHYSVWQKGIKVREFDVRDTIPGLGKIQTEGEDDNGNTQGMTIPKDYEFFVTVK
jgi:hypothetical protein